MPGRGKRISEPLLYNIEAMTDDLYLQIENNIYESYVIYGHSLGALLGFTLCRHISLKDRNKPLMLFLSGQTAPSLIKSDNMHTLPDDRFINMLREMEGTPEELLSDESFLQFFLPIVRADFQSISEYQYTILPKLDVPMTIMLGTEEQIPDKDASLWKLETNSSISINHFKGGHFFIFNQAENVCKLITEKMNGI